MYLKRGDTVALSKSEINSFLGQVTHLVIKTETEKESGTTACLLGVWLKKTNGLPTDRRVKKAPTCLYCAVSVEC